MKTFLITLLCVLPCISTAGQDTLTFRIVSYNVENLFDFQHDSLKNDYEYLPGATRHWDYFKYRKKLDGIARSIIATGGWTPPALVALCEVENEKVMRDLTRYSALREAGYRYILTNSNDHRGIDVALMYQRGLFKPLAWQQIPVTKPDRHSLPTRDILHVYGQILNMDTLDVFVVHWPSRSDGAKASEPYRLSAARQLRHSVDSICQRRLTPQIIIMGDFNDYPDNRSLSQILKAGPPPAYSNDLQPHSIYSLLSHKTKKRTKPWQHTINGSYKYKGEWGLLDHILVSGNLLKNTSRLYTSPAMADISTLPFLLTEDPKYGGSQPFRTYLGPRYLGGYSDHLPIYADFRLIY